MLFSLSKILECETVFGDVSITDLQRFERVAAGAGVLFDRGPLAADGSVRGSVTGFAAGKMTLVLPGGKVWRIVLRKDSPVAF